MINYNIMNIILDKKAFKEWQYRVRDINKEYKEKYRVYVYDINSYILKDYILNIDEDFNGYFMYIFYKERIYCEGCIYDSEFHVDFNHRDGDGIYCKYILSIYEKKCDECRGIRLPINYL